jgi:hypothetical protein
MKILVVRRVPKRFLRFMNAGDRYSARERS